MQPAISIQGLSKKYNLATTNSYVALRDVLTNKAKNLFRSQKERASSFWALQDINLDIAEGERIGIIGHNGAGKSTLLKIISRITPPTTGKVVLNGRVASLLEVGTGFHPELTGRENIYLNGSILGLKKKEIDSKLDEIIDFSGVEKFIDAPLKQYSSGMQLRLAFSVAAHLEAEILLIDEVLAVGDIEFQKKCIGKMEEISKSSGRTIVFVSHNMAAIKQLCKTALLLQMGKISYLGNVNSTIEHYSCSSISHIKEDNNSEFDLRNHPNKCRKDEGIFSARIYMNNETDQSFIPGGSIRIAVKYFLKTNLIDPEIGIVIKDENHNSLIGLNNKHLGKKISLMVNEEKEAVISLIDVNIYKPGKYLIDLYLGDIYHFYECLYDALEFTIVEKDIYKSGVLLNPLWNTIFIPRIEIST